MECLAAVVYSCEICLLSDGKGLSNKYTLSYLDSTAKGHSLRRSLFDTSPPLSPATQLYRTERFCSCKMEPILHYKSFRKK